MKSTSFALVYHDLCRLMRDARPFESSGERLIAPNPYVDDAKRWYCDHVGYADQARACAAWLYDGCTIRTTKYGIGTARGIAVPAAAEAATGGGVSFHPTGSGSGDEVTLAGETGQAATELGGGTHRRAGRFPSDEDRVSDKVDWTAAPTADRSSETRSDFSLRRAPSRPGV